ncbi:MAG TPA: neuraminidase-like domain-containing protein [Haliangium sp.]|nr:neuraminidase-like domain-containing protein [Haliangium sp.]
MNPSFIVPAEYFYALAAHFPPEVTVETRYQMACLLGETQIRDQLRTAIERGFISNAPAPISGGAAVTPEQAARRLHSLGRVKGLPACKVPPSSSDELHELIAGWLDFANTSPKDDPAEDIRPFWENLSAAATLGHLRLVLAALTEQPESDLIEELNVATVQELAEVTAAEWMAVFEANPELLPEFTRPGTRGERINAFIRRVEHFFDVTVTGEPFTPPSADGPPSFGVLAGDPLRRFLDYYAIHAGTNFELGQPVDASALDGAVHDVFPDDPQAQRWLARAITVLSELFEVTTGIGEPPEESPCSMQFSLMEALYARGFTTKSSIASMSLPDFTDALTGTVAHQHATLLWQNAGGTQGSVPGEGPGAQPINPDGSLVNCVPPPHRSPFGPVAYLHELLQLSAVSTCAEPAPVGGQPALAAAVNERRGPFGDLHVTRANVETPLPLIDLVNECLEALATQAPANLAGVVYDTAALELNGHTLKNPDSSDPSVRAHDPATLFAAMPEHSSPATPVKKPGGYEKLRSDFSAPVLPYSQPVDVCRSYLEELRSTRYAVMRRFRSDITEFVLAPQNEPSEFRRHLWRYPVRWEIAREYLGMTPEEEAIFTHDISDADLAKLYGFSPEDAQWTTRILALPVFLDRTGLRYCELADLIASEWVTLRVVNRKTQNAYDFLPECEPCCLDDYALHLGSPVEIQSLRRLIVFIRLWQKLQHVDGAGYAFTELRDICEVLVLFHSDGSTNPEFARQLAAFQLLRDHFSLGLFDPSAGETGAGETGADRTHLLALWVGPTAAKWNWAVEHLLAQLRHYAQARFECSRRSPEFLKLLAENLTPLSILAGFDPADPLATWYAHPTHTLRFAEILAKIYASSFGVGEILFLFTVADHLNGDDPLPLASDNETLDSPLDLPDDDPSYSLWELRRKLLAVEVSDDDVESWTWARIDASLREEFGFDPASFGTDPLVSFAQHFFPTILEQYGSVVEPSKRQYRVTLDTTAPLMWNTPPHGPFRYDVATKELWTELPLQDEAVLKKISRVKPLSSAEQQAVQDLYFSPRTDLARFAFLFPSWIEADARLIQEPDPDERWRYFQRAFALAHARCRVLAEHVSAHVAQVTGMPNAEGWGLAWVLLKHLFADENKGQTPWETNDGKPPKVTWTPPPSGGAFAALLGLLGTGMRGELRAHDGNDASWLELRGPMDAFGSVRNDWNAPVPTVLPAMDLTLTPDALRFVGMRNGFALQGDDAERLGGARGFCVTWRGVLLVENAGSYSFYGGSPTPDGQKPALECAEGQRWRVTLTQGQKSWVVLSHDWHGKDTHATSAMPLPLKRGTYDLVVDFVQCPPVFDRPDALPTKTGFQLKYAGPDTDDQLVVVPSRRLFVALKDGPLAAALDSDQQGKARQFLEVLYFSTLRDVRRTYQRAFKALLFAHHLALSAKPVADSGQSEIGYMLDHAEDFEGLSFFHQGPDYEPHRAWLDFNLLPVGDSYHPPSAAQDQRVAPSVQRQQAMFDWWERLFDYTALRKSIHKVSEAPVWLAFHEAAEHHADDPAHLLRHMGVDLSHATLVRTFYRNDEVTSAELEDERWAIRVWRAEEWLRLLVKNFTYEDVRDARPDLWASDDPGKVEAPESQSGNQNLTRFVQDGYFENGEPLRYEDLKRLNDGLRERARTALLAYLCSLDRVPLPWGGFAEVPKDLSELLLIDVEAGLSQRASRIEEAITATQLFVHRARLGLELGWKPGAELVQLWDRRFASLRIWQACKRRELYKENYIEWDELEKARASEAFRLLEDQLRSSALTVAAPAGLTIWNSERPPAHPGIRLLQAREPSVLAALAPPRQGLSLLGTPERHARPSWLASPGMAQAVPEGDRAHHVSGRSAVAATNEAPLVKGKLPYWIEAAIQLGARFVRVAAAGLPVGASSFDQLESDAHGCCRDCGEVHPPVVDEYYFWILDSRHFQAVVQDANIRVDGVNLDEVGSPWHDEKALPKLLYWKHAPMVHLFWARVHNGELKQMRRSAEGVRIHQNPTQQPDLEFIGRFADSLCFEVTGAEAPQDDEAEAPHPGFRYDLPTDTAEVVPPVVAEAAAPAAFFDVLPAYPYFVDFTPGAPLVPPTFFSQAVSVATTLRAHCRFEAAVKWYEEVFNPLNEDAAWCRSTPVPSRTSGDDERPENDSHGTVVLAQNPDSQAAGRRSKQRKRRTKTQADEGIALAAAAAAVNTQLERCCKGGTVTADVARDRAITLDYVETLLDWGDALMRRHSPEDFQQARLIFDTSVKILGAVPRTVFDVDSAPTPVKVKNFVPSAPPLNPRLMALYERVEDRLAVIHAGLNARRLRNGTPNLDMPYFGDIKLRDGWQSTAEACADDADWCLPACAYRFVFLVQKALELAGEVRGLGAALLAAYEKGDAEYLASLRAGHERQLLTLALEIRQNQWREADWQVQALRKTKEIAQTRRSYYQGLIDIGLIADEVNYKDLTNASMAARTAANVSEGIGQIMNIIPNIFVGTVNFTELPIGTKLAAMFAAIARISNTVADILGTQAGLSLTQAGFERREDEWFHQVEVLDIEIEQIERQILAAERRRDIALRELNNHQRQLEQSAEVQDFLRDKFTAHELYLWLQKETTALYYQMYELALHSARQAQRAFNYERGHTARTFLKGEIWDDLHEGLLAGERLDLALRTMEKAYLCENLREYELVKHVSLRQLFPLQLLQLKVTGQCEVELPEWLFDLDYPGHYMRRIKNVSITIPCVVGPFTGVHCRLTLLSSTTRIDPRLLGPVARCCDKPAIKPGSHACAHCGHVHAPAPLPVANDEPPRNGYPALPEDARIVKQYAATEAIATSSGQNDTGLFELNFRDERYLPFEFAGAVSRWRLELPPENNYFDLSTVTDVVLHLNYTAREGGDVLRRAAAEVAKTHLPDSGCRLFDIKVEFPDAWYRFAERSPARAARSLELGLSNDLFRYLPGQPSFDVTRIELLFELACPPGGISGFPAEWTVELTLPERDDCADDDECPGPTRLVHCVASSEWPGLYHGVAELEPGFVAMTSKSRVIRMRFPGEMQTVERLFVVCGYRAHTHRPLLHHVK